MEKIDVKRFRLLAALLTLLSTTWTVYAAQPTIDDGRLLLHSGATLQTQPLALNGTWRFFPNRWVTPAELPAVAASAGSARVPGTWPNPMQGIGTYWLEVIVDNSVALPSTLRFNLICGAASV